MQEHADDASLSPLGLWRHALLSVHNHAWPLVKASLATRILVAAVYAPVAAACLHLGLVLQGKPVVTDTQIAALAASPLGLLGLFAAGVLLLAGWGAELLALVTVLRSPPTSLYRLLRRTVSSVPTTVRIAMRMLVSAGVWAAPCLAVFAVTYVALLSKYDINYYLANRPLAFWAAGVILLTGAAYLLWHAVRIATDWFAAAALAADGMSAAETRLEAQEVAKANGPAVRKALWLWVLFGLVLPALLTALGAVVFALVSPWWPRSVAAIATGVGLWLLVGWISGQVVTFLSTALLAGLVDGTVDQERTPPTDEVPLDEPPRSRWAIPAIVAAVIATSVFAGYRAMHRVSAPTKVEVIAHRGASAVAPENTLAAIEAAIEAGADWVEIDVQETADGEVIVFHDSDFMKAGNNATKVWEIDSPGLAQIDVGAYFGKEFVGERVPTLRQVLEACRDRIGVLIELKYYGHDESLEQRVVDLVEETSMVDQTRFMSLKPQGIQKLKALRPDWQAGLLLSVYLGDSKRLEADFLAMNASFISPGTIDSARDNDAYVYAWTVNDPAKMGALASIGVAGLITDDPALARDSLEDWRELSPIGRLLVTTVGSFTPSSVDAQ